MAFLTPPQRTLSAPGHAQAWDHTLFKASVWVQNTDYIPYASLVHCILGGGQHPRIPCFPNRVVFVVFVAINTCDVAALFSVVVLNMGNQTVNLQL